MIVFVALDILIILIGVALAFGSLRLLDTRQATGSALLAVACYLFLLPLMIRSLLGQLRFADGEILGGGVLVFVDWTDSYAAAMPLCVALMFAGMAAMGFGIARWIRRAVIWNGLFLMLGVLAGLLMLAIANSHPSGDGGLAAALAFWGLYELVRWLLKLMVCGDAIMFLGLFGWLLTKDAFRRAVTVALVLGSLGAALEGFLVRTRGAATWSQIAGLDVIMLGVVISACLFGVARSLGMRSEVGSTGTG